MPEHLNPCTHCGGTGKEPSPVDVAWLTLTGELGDSRVPDSVCVAAGAYQNAATARITCLEAALRDILGRFGPANRMLGNSQMLQVPNEDVRGLRAVLAGHLEVNPASSYPGGEKP